MTYISTLKEENKMLRKKIASIKRKENTRINKKITTLRKISKKKRYVKQRIFLLNHSYQLFTHLLQNRKSISITVQSNLLKQQEISLQKTIYIQEQIRLKNTDKIHNFTDFSPPKDITSLLNKGTNFIPTADKPSRSSINKQVTSEVNEALISTIIKTKSQLQR